MAKPEEILADNLARLIADREELKSQGALGRKAKIDQRTVGRIVNREHSPTLDKIAKLAVACRVDPWRLLAPNLGVDFVVGGAGDAAAVVEIKPHADGDVESDLLFGFRRLSDVARSQVLAYLHAAGDFDAAGERRAAPGGSATAQHVRERARRLALISEELAELEDEHLARAYPRVLQAIEDSRNVSSPSQLDAAAQAANAPAVAGPTPPRPRSPGKPRG